MHPFALWLFVNCFCLFLVILKPWFPTLPKNKMKKKKEEMNYFTLSQNNVVQSGCFFPFVL